MASSEHGDDQERIDRISRIARRVHRRQLTWLLGATGLFWLVWGTVAYFMAAWLGGDFVVGFIAGAIGWIGFSALATDLMSIFQEELDRDLGDEYLQAARRREEDEPSVKSGG